MKHLLVLDPEDIDFHISFPDGLVVEIKIYSDDLDLNEKEFIEINFEGFFALVAKDISAGSVPEYSSYGVIGAAFLIGQIAFRTKARASRE